MGRIDDEVDAAAGMGVHDGFAGLREFYVSPHGHTRLFYASRYGKAYVLKCLKADYLYTPLYRRALAKEFEIGLQLDHPCICRTIGMEEVGGLGQAIVMERVDGCTLESIIKEGSLTRALARRIAAQAAGAVDYMHGKQVVHRDLKPSNIMVTHNGHNVKIVDFSLADSDAFEMLKQPGGTSGYIAPEQLLSGAKADVRSDMYSLGMVMRDMAAATGDRRMMRAAEVCTRRNAAGRPAGGRALRAVMARVRAQRRAVVVLGVIVALLGAVVVSTLCGWLPGGMGAFAGHDSPADGNEAADYASWPEF